MRIGCVYTECKRWPKFRWFMEALARAGHVVSRVTTIEELRDADGTCDAILFEQREPGVGRKRIRDFGPHRSVWASVWWDLLIAQQHQSLLELYGDMLRVMDLVFVKERGLIESYLSLGIKAVYLDQGCPSHLPECVRQPEFDVLVIGSKMPVYEQRRSDAIALANAGFTVGWAGDGGRTPPGVSDVPWAHPERFADLCGKGNVILSVDLRSDVEGYTSDRLWLAMACGACVLKRFTPGLPDAPFVTYRDEQELIHKTQHLLGTDGGHGITPLCPPEVLKIGKEARAWSLQHNTLDHKCREMLQHVRRAVIQAN